MSAPGSASASASTSTSSPASSTSPIISTSRTGISVNHPHHPHALPTAHHQHQSPPQPATMPGIGTNPSYYDPDTALAGPPGPALNYAQFLQFQQQMQGYAQPHAQPHPHHQHQHQQQGNYAYEPGSGAGTEYGGSAYGTATSASGVGVGMDVGMGVGMDVGTFYYSYGQPHAHPQQPQQQQQQQQQQFEMYVAPAFQPQHHQQQQQYESGFATGANGVVGVQTQGQAPGEAPGQVSATPTLAGTPAPTPTPPVPASAPTLAASAQGWGPVYNDQQIQQHQQQPMQQQPQQHPQQHAPLQTHQVQQQQHEQQVQQHSGRAPSTQRTRWRAANIPSSSSGTTGKRERPSSTRAASSSTVVAASSTSTTAAPAAAASGTATNTGGGASSLANTATSSAGNGTAASTQTSRKRAKRNVPVEPESGDSDSDDDVGFGNAFGLSGGAGGGSASVWNSAAMQEQYAGLMGLGNNINSGGGGRLPGACTHCKKLKMKCEFPQNENVCKRCKTGGHACVVEGRKPRSAPNKREYLLAQIRQKDAIIESLLKQLHNPYMATPLSIAAYRMASSPSDAHGSRNVIQWLERLQQSVHNAPAGGNVTRSFKIDTTVRRKNHARGDSTAVEDKESESELEMNAHADIDGDGTSGAKTHGVSSTESGTTIGADGEGRESATAQGSAQTNPPVAVSETLRQCDSLPDDAVPIGLLANLSIEQQAGRTRSKAHKAAVGPSSMDESGKGSIHEYESEDDDNVGVANETYFMPGPATDLGVRKALIERHSPPEILVHGLVTAEDVDHLFEIFYEKVNPFLSLLDPELHTPASTFARCPFLFTVVCAISSRYYREKSEIYAIAMHFAKHAAATALIDGWKSVELCQAYLLMAVYAVPARRWEEDRSWLYIGLAIRLATDLNLHQASSIKATSEQHEREIVNRTRVWMICFNLDRSSATQFGKPSTIKEDYIIRNSKDWYKRSKVNHPYDIHLCAYSSLLRIIAKFHEDIYSDLDSPSGLNQNTDFRAITLAHDEKLDVYFKEWTQKFKDDSDPNDKACKFRCTLLPFLVNYSRLVMFSFGFQQAFRRGFQAGDDLFFNKCMESASNVIRCIVDSLAPSGYFRYAPDGHFVFASFASAFLLKLLRPEFSNFITREQTNQIFALIGKLIQVLASSEVSIDDRHTPKLYARFLAGLLAKHQPGGSSSGRLHPRQPPEGHMPDAEQSSGQGIMGPGSGTSQSVFHIGAAPPPGNSPHHGASQRPLSHIAQEQSQGMGVFSPLSMSSTPVDTPIYEADATYAIGTGPLELSSADAAAQFGFGASGIGGDGAGLGLGYGSAMQDEEMLATMRAIKSSAFWEDMMMPGFVWPDAHMPIMQQMTTYT